MIRRVSILTVCVTLTQTACPSPPATRTPTGALASADPGPRGATPVVPAASSGVLVDDSPDVGEAYPEVWDHGEPDGPSPSPENVARFVHPFDGVSDAELERRLLFAPGSLGSASVGTANGGRLFNGVAMPPDGVLYRRVDPANEWGTEETVRFLARAISVVHERFPDTQPLSLGHISSRDGGPLSPHKSHQSGRDVDIGYYYKNPTRWYRRATAENLDVARTWAFCRALIVHTDIHLILMDASIQRLVRAHAESIGEDPAWLDRLFKGTPGVRGHVFLHVPGHATHLHLRFYNRVAQEAGRRLYPLLLEHGLIQPVARFIVHRARRGESLGRLARRYGTTVRAIKRANGLRRSVIIAGHRYRIPKRVRGAPQRPRPVHIPPRVLPPDARSPGPVSLPR